MAATAQTQEEIGKSVQVLLRARKVQQSWASLSVRQRLKVVKKFRRGLAERAGEMTPLFAGLKRSAADSLSAEIVPLAEAARYLELWAEELLRPREVGTVGRPAWLSGVTLRVWREPHGVVLVIGPANYPLFLTGVQTLQALVAGNAVIWKPGARGKAVADFTAGLFERAGLPSGLLLITDESVERGREFIAAGVDKMVMTGSAEAGRSALALCAAIPVPATVELSGCDACFIFPGANLKRAAEALAFGRTLNGGETCIAPQRVFVHSSLSEKLRALLAEAGMDGLPVTTVADADAAVRLANESPYALGASIFADEMTADELAKRIRAGVVLINDMIAPTADPRLSFGGRGASGFGKTRGEEGLLEMTVSKAVMTQRSRRLRHLEPEHPRAQDIFEAYLQLRHGEGLRRRAGALSRLCRAAMGRN